MLKFELSFSLFVVLWRSLLLGNNSFRLFDFVLDTITCDVLSKIASCCGCCISGIIWKVLQFVLFLPVLPWTAFRGEKAPLFSYLRLLPAA